MASQLPSRVRVGWVKEGKRSLSSQIDTESRATQVKAKASFQLESKRYNEDEIHQCNDKALIQVVERGNDFFSVR